VRAAWPRVSGERPDRSARCRRRSPLRKPSGSRRKSIRAGVLASSDHRAVLARHTPRWHLRWTFTTGTGRLPTRNTSGQSRSSSLQPVQAGEKDHVNGKPPPRAEACLSFMPKTGRNRSELSRVRKSHRSSRTPGYRAAPARKGPAAHHLRK